MVWQGTAQDMSKMSIKTTTHHVAIVVRQAVILAKDQAPRRRRSFRRCTRPFSRRSAASEAQDGPSCNLGVLGTATQRIFEEPRTVN